MSGSAISFTRGEDPLRADKLNAAFAERVLRSGDTMTGYLTLVGDPIDPFHAATKQYIDSVVITAVGGAYLPLAGGTVTGPLNVVGTLTLGGGGSTSQAIAASGTGNFLLTLGGTSSLFNFRNSAGTSMLQLGGANSTISARKQITLSGPYAITGAASTDAALFMNQTYAGSSTGPQSSLVFLQSVENVTMDANTSLAGLFVKMTGSGANIQGNRQAASLQYTLSSQPTDTGFGTNYVGLVLKSDVMVTAGGTAPNLANGKGTNFAFNPVMHMGPSATNWRAGVCAEFDIWNEAGSSVMDRKGILITLIDGATGSVARDNAALAFDCQAFANRTGWETLISLGRQGGHWPLSTTGYIMRAILPVGDATPTVAGGIDFTALNFSGNSIAVPGLTVRGNGTINAASLPTSSAGLVTGDIWSNGGVLCVV